MPLNSVFSWFIKKRGHQIDLFKKYPTEVQAELFQRLVSTASLTSFGLEHKFLEIKNIQDFKKSVPIRGYEEMKPYIDRLRDGEQGVLWPSKVKWFAKSSGTTSARSKFIPVTKEALEDCHYKGGKDLIALYYGNNPNANLYGGKHLVMGGSSKITSTQHDAYSGDLSAIIIQNLPIWVELKRTPSREIALMDNWEEKIERMARSTIQDDVYMLTGVPSWTLVLIKRIMELAETDSILDVWPNLQMFMHGGVSFKPYKEQFKKLIPKDEMHYCETYNASEGFFGIQDRLDGEDLLLMLDYGIFYEFMPMSEFGKESPETVGLEDVEVGQVYALIISTNAGLWRYLIGDTIRFTSVYPFRIQVTGRTKHFINAFGEEVIIENTDTAVTHASSLTKAQVTDYTVAPIYMSGDQTGGHEWLVEFAQAPDDLERFIDLVDQKLCDLNSDYAAKRVNDLTIRRPQVRVLEEGSFYQWLKSKGKIGGQHKVPRLSNDRAFIEDILSTIVVSNSL